MSISIVQLFKEIRKQRKLADKRHPMYDQNRFAKFFIYFSVALWIAYLVLFGVLLVPMFRDLFPGMEPYHILNKGMLFIVMLDFFTRFIFQKIPVQEIKPYVLMPVKKKNVLNCHLALSGLNSYNLVWFFLLIPFACQTLFKFFGVGGIIGFLVGYWLLMLANNYWYLFCRTLMNEKMVYVLIPIVFYAVALLTYFLPATNHMALFTMEFGEGFILWEVGSFVGILVLIVALFFLNQVLQSRVIYKELSKTQVTKLRTVSEYKFLDRFGEIGEYMRLEIKLLTRNKVPKTQFRTGLLLMLMFSLLLAFTDVYDENFMRYFICVYNFSVLGVMVLSQTMSFEGNYLDGLMSRKESILSLLKAKYYVHCVIVLVPLLIMLFPIIKGKISFLGAISSCLLTTGFIFWILMQLAVYNKKTVNLNTKVMGRNSGGNFFQTLIIMTAFFLPVIVITVLTSVLSEHTALLIILAIGVLFTLLHPLWLRNVYKRFMKQRYVNMEGFRSSRN